MRPVNANIDRAAGKEGGEGAVQGEPVREPDPAPLPGPPCPEVAGEGDQSTHEEAGYGYGV